MVARIFVYNIPYRRALGLAAFRPSARASKSVLHKTKTFPESFSMIAKKLQEIDFLGKVIENRARNTITCCKADL